MPLIVFDSYVTSNHIICNAKKTKKNTEKTKQKVYDLIYTRAYLGPCQATTIEVLDTSLISSDIALGHSAQLRPLTCLTNGLHGYKVTLSI